MTSATADTIVDDTSSINNTDLEDFRTWYPVPRQAMIPANTRLCVDTKDRGIKKYDYSIAQDLLVTGNEVTYYTKEPLLPWSRPRGWLVEDISLMYGAHYGAGVAINSTEFALSDRYQDPEAPSIIAHVSEIEFLKDGGDRPYQIGPVLPPLSLSARSY